VVAYYVLIGFVEGRVIRDDEIRHLRVDVALHQCIVRHQVPSNQLGILGATVYNDIQSFDRQAKRTSWYQWAAAMLGTSERQMAIHTCKVAW
jgi:hypothetical protein